MADQSGASVQMAMCVPCLEERHDACTSDTLGAGCICRCMSTVKCPSCEKAVVLWADEEGMERGECCRHVWIGLFDGVDRYNLDDPYATFDALPNTESEETPRG